MRRLAIVAILSACTAARAAPSLTRDARAKQILDAQIDALKKGGDAIVATFSSEAVVLVPDARAAATAPMLRDAISRTSPHEAVRSIRVIKVVAGGDDAVLWFSAELDVVKSGGEPGTKQTGSTARVRVTELATADAGWKVIAAAFSEPNEPSMRRAARDEVPSTTDAGPLAPLVADASKLGAALASDASTTVFGTDKDESAYGPAAARALVKGWAKLAFALQGKSREVRAKRWGFAIANVDWQRTGDRYLSRMAALVIAVPDGDAWRVVAVHYTAI